MEPLLASLILIALMAAVLAETRKQFPFASRIVETIFRRAWRFVFPPRKNGRDWASGKQGFALLDRVRVSPQRFYALLESAILRRRIAGLQRPVRVFRREGPFWRDRRECLRLTRGGLVCDVCAAPCGTGCYVSWRFRHRPTDVSSWILVMPALLQLMKRAREPRTEDQEDQFRLFEEAVRRSLDEAIQQATGAHGVRPAGTAVFRGIQSP